MIEVKKLSVSFRDGGKNAVQDVSFEMQQGEIVAIIGESGSGKTMTALSIAGLLPKNAEAGGEILLEGKNLLTMPERERRKIKGRDVSMIFQEPMTSLNPVMKIGKQVEEPLLLHGSYEKHERKKMTCRMLASVGLSDAEKLYDAYPHQLSGGMRQRVMIAMALICRPKLMIADEPTTALDVEIQKQILELLKEINRERKTSILFISHNLSLVKNFCNRILVMHHGRIVEEGTPTEIFTAPKDEYTKILLSSIPSDKGIEWKSIQKTHERVLEVKHLNVYYPSAKKKKQIIYDASFEITKGEAVGLIGGSGSGKSTLSKAILGLNNCIDGEIKHYTKYPQMIFQDPYGSLNPSKTIGWILEEPLRMQGKFSKLEREAKVYSILQKVGLSEEYTKRYPKELSGGQRQRVGIALALIMGTRFIVADEPVSALDVTIQAQILELLIKLKEEMELSYLFISHDMAVVSQVCDRVLVIKNGKLCENDKTNGEKLEETHNNL